ncbi:MAG: hypothetical protein JXL84_17440 [Deltaproteobacteria bacterium]|nr:hypothetical protein [Deltaproteobacteria bacterium]
MVTILKWVGVALLLLTRVSAVAAATDGKPPGLHYGNGLVSLKGGGMQLMEVLEGISRSAGLEIILFDLPRSSALRAELHQVPLEDALSRILRGYSYAIIHQPGNVPGNVRVFEKPRTFTNRKDRAATADEHQDIPGTGAGGLAPERVSSFPPRKATNSGGREAEHKVSAPSSAADPQFRYSPSSHGGPGSATPLPVTVSTDTAAEGTESPSPTSSPGTGVAGAQSALPQQDAMETGGGTPGQVAPAGYTRATGGGSYEQYLQQRIASGISDREYEKWAAVRGSAYVMHDRERLANHQAMMAGQ